MLERPWATFPVAAVESLVMCLMFILPSAMRAMQYIASGIFSNMTPSNKRHLAKLQRTAASAIYDKTKFLSAHPALWLDGRRLVADLVSQSPV